MCLNINTSKLCDESRNYDSTSGEESTEVVLFHSPIKKKRLSCSPLSDRDDHCSLASLFSWTPKSINISVFWPLNLYCPLPASLPLVICCLARPLSGGCRTQMKVPGVQCPLSVSTHCPQFPLPQLLSLSLSLSLSLQWPNAPPSLQPPTSVHITRVLEIDSLPKEWELEQMEYEWFTHVWKRCPGKGSGVGGPSIAN